MSVKIGNVHIARSVWSPRALARVLAGFISGKPLLGLLDEARRKGWR
jgi:hypothetical protein